MVFDVGLGLQPQPLGGPIFFLSFFFGRGVISSCAQDWILTAQGSFLAGEGKPYGIPELNSGWPQVQKQSKYSTHCTIITLAHIPFFLFLVQAAAHPSVQGEWNPHTDPLLCLSDPSISLHVLVLWAASRSEPIPSAISHPLLLQCGQCLPHRTPNLLVLTAVQEGISTFWCSPCQKGWLTEPRNQADMVPPTPSCLLCSVFRGPESWVTSPFWVLVSRWVWVFLKRYLYTHLPLLQSTFYLIKTLESY